MILFEDEHVLVLNKPFGIAVQGGTGTKRHIDGILAGMADRFGDRPRLVHRLDRDTTGVLLVAKHRDAAAKLGRIFQTRSAAKTYWALVKGVPKPPQGKVEAALVKAAGPDGDRVRKAQPGEQDKAMHATTHYSVIDRVAHKAAWVSLKPVTGRQHQLRAHMALIGHPDRRRQQVRGRQGAGRQRHRGQAAPARAPAGHPASGRGRAKIDVTAPLPEHMRTTLGAAGPGRGPLRCRPGQRLMLSSRNARQRISGMTPTGIQSASSSSTHSSNCSGFAPARNAAMSAAMVVDGFHAPLASSASTSSLPSGLPMHNFIASLSSAPTRPYELPVRFCNAAMEV